MSAARLEIVALDGIPEVRNGDDLAAHIVEALRASDLTLQPGDVLVVTQKVVSKAEGRVVNLADVEPSALAHSYARRWERDPRQVEVVLRESAEVVRMTRGLIIGRTRHGFVCANAGVDLSNVEGADQATLLPVDPDASARSLRERLGELTGVAPAILISDSFGRAWRNGIVNVAIGAAGIEALLDLRGRPDAQGREMRSTVVAVADELASAADLAGGKVDQRPVVLIRGYSHGRGDAGDGGAAALVMDRENDLFP